MRDLKDFNVLRGVATHYDAQGRKVPLFYVFWHRTERSFNVVILDRNTANIPLRGYTRTDYESNWENDDELESIILHLNQNIDSMSEREALGLLQSLKDNYLTEKQFCFSDVERALGDPLFSILREIRDYKPYTVIFKPLEPKMVIKTHTFIEYPDDPHYRDLTQNQWLRTDGQLEETDSISNEGDYKSETIKAYSIRGASYVALFSTEVDEDGRTHKILTFYGEAISRNKIFALMVTDPFVFCRGDEPGLPCIPEWIEEDEWDKEIWVVAPITDNDLSNVSTKILVDLLSAHRKSDTLY